MSSCDSQREKPRLLREDGDVAELIQNICQTQSAASLQPASGTRRCVYDQYNAPPHVSERLHLVSDNWQVVRVEGTV